jgi:mRNA interferase MazF
VNLDPTIGAEICKSRPVVVLSSDAVGKLPVKLVVPVTEWKDQFEETYWHVRIEPTKSNGLTKSSSADALQARGVDIQRFVEKVGSLPAVTVDEIAAALAAVVEYQ